MSTTEQVVTTEQVLVGETSLHVLKSGTGRHMCLWAHDGYMTHADTVRCIELFGTEVLPALRADQTAADVPVAAAVGAPGAS